MLLELLGQEVSSRPSSVTFSSAAVSSVTVTDGSAGDDVTPTEEQSWKHGCSSRRWSSPTPWTPLQDLGKALRKAGASLPLELVHLRASQINGCSVCVDMHAKALKQSGETDERLSRWPPGGRRPYFDDDERAALALAEAMTRLSDRADAVSDEVWAEAARHYNEERAGDAHALHRHA